MTPVFRFVAGAWTFFWRQPALLRSTFLLVFLPMTAMGYLDVPATDEPQQIAVLVVLHVAAAVLLTWGMACTLVVGRRILQAKAGRLRTSFNAVQGQARGLIVPLLLTDILRGCITALWGLPFFVMVIIAVTLADERHLSGMQLLQTWPWLIPLGILLVLPAIHYALRTVLAPLVVVYEKLSFRPALARSGALTKGRLGRTLLVVIVLCILWIPGIAAEELLVRFAPAEVSTLAIPPVTAFFDTFALVLWLLAMTQFYKALGGKAKAGADEE